MTLKLDFPPDVLAQIEALAHRKGLSVDEFLSQAILNQLSAEGSRPNEQDSRLAAREAAERIRALRRGLALGPDLTIRNLIEEGRRF